MGTLIIFGIFVMAAFWSGFFVGYLKREGKAPETPIPKTFKMIRDIKAKPDEPHSFFD